MNYFKHKITSEENYQNHDENEIHMKYIQMKDILSYKNNDFNKSNYFNSDQIYVAFLRVFFMKTTYRFFLIYKLTDKLTMFIKKFQPHEFFCSNFESI
jgi:hypothetical protein